MDRQDLKNWYRSNKRIISFILAACFVILFYHIITSTNQIENSISKITSVLSPFIFGAVLAYLLRPACNFVANTLKKVKFMPSWDLTVRERVRFLLYW